MGTEGNGCCPLNCSHVYGYTMLLERLFPELAKDMLETNFQRCFDPKVGVTDDRCGLRFYQVERSVPRRKVMMARGRITLRTEC